MKILIAYNIPTEMNSPDDLDVLNQVMEVRRSLEKFNHRVEEFGVDLNLYSFQNKIYEFQPDIVFNLVEAINGIEQYMHFVPQMLERMKIPFTGGSSQSLYLTTNKILTKRMFDSFNIPTPIWFDSVNVSSDIDYSIPYIIKPISVDASVGIDDSSIVYDNKNLLVELKTRTEKYGECFIEEFIQGREFNISVIGTETGPLLLPMAEIKFEDYPASKAKIVGYDAKWDQDSFEYSHTVRNFDFQNHDNQLLKKLEEVTLQCWKKFELKGYARVDFRVDHNNNIYVLEINVNPCITSDSGFFSACEKFGWNYNDMVKNILNTVIQ